jgi:hypothetical protein
MGNGLTKEVETVTISITVNKTILPHRVLILSYFQNHGLSGKGPCLKLLLVFQNRHRDPFRPSSYLTDRDILLTNDPGAEESESK